MLALQPYLVRIRSSPIRSPVGPSVYIGPYCIVGIASMASVRRLRPACRSSAGVTSTPAARRWLSGARRDAFSAVTIGADCWIGAGAIIMADVGAARPSAPARWSRAHSAAFGCCRQPARVIEQASEAAGPLKGWRAERNEDPAPASCDTMGLQCPLESFFLPAAIRLPPGAALPRCAEYGASSQRLSCWTSPGVRSAHASGASAKYPEEGLKLRGLSRAGRLVRRGQRGRGSVFPRRRIQEILHRAFPDECFHLASLAERHGMRFIEVDNLNSDSAAEALTALKPDLAIVLGTRVLRRSTFGVPRLGSNQPSQGVTRYRGMPPGFWELYNGEKSAGVTVHLWTTPWIPET